MKTFLFEESLEKRRRSVGPREGVSELAKVFSELAGVVSTLAKVALLIEGPLLWHLTRPWR